MGDTADFDEERKKRQPSIVPKTDLDQRIADLNEQFAVVMRGNQVLIMRHWVGSDGVSQLRFFDRKGFDLLMANKKIVSSDKKLLPLSKLWLESPHRQEYEDVYFRPGDKDYPNRYNLWQGFAVKSIKDKGNIEGYLSHIKDNICKGDPEIYQWVISFMADIVQKPYRKIGAALVLRGEMGVGKGCFAMHFGKLFGVHYLPITQSGQLTGRFNSHLAGKVVVFMDEGGWYNDKHGAGIIRALITEAQITIEGKGRDAICMDNHCHLIIAANDDYIVPTGMDDERRMCVLDVGEGNIRDAIYFKAIQTDMDNGGYESLLYFLENYKYDESILRQIPKTDALLDQKMYSMKPEVKWWYGCLVAEKIGKFTFSEDYSSSIDTKEFYDQYVSFCETMRIDPIVDSELPKALRKYIELVKMRKGPRGGRYHEYVIPEIKIARALFDKKTGQNMPWPIETYDTDD